MTPFVENVIGFLYAYGISFAIALFGFIVFILIEAKIENAQAKKENAKKENAQRW
jgi:dipeptide/tripeptide permease